MLNKTVGLLLVTFGIVLIFRTLSGFGFFQQMQSNLHWGKMVEAQYNVIVDKSTLHLTLYKDSTFQERIDAKGEVFLSSGNWHFTDTINHIFEIEILKSDIDTIIIPQTRTYKIDYTGISLYTDTATLNRSPMGFKIDKEFTIVSIHKSNIRIPNIENIIVDCNGWNLNNQQITNVIKSSVYVESKIWKNEFDVMPCILDIRIEQEKTPYHIQMNAGGWFSVSIDGSTVYYGNYIIENKGLFL